MSTSKNLTTALRRYLTPLSVLATLHRPRDWENRPSLSRIRGCDDDAAEVGGWLVSPSLSVCSRGEESCSDDISMEDVMVSVYCCWMVCRRGRWRYGCKALGVLSWFILRGGGRCGAQLLVIRRGYFSVNAERSAFYQMQQESKKVEKGRICVWKGRQLLGPCLLTLSLNFLT